MTLLQRAVRRVLMEKQAFNPLDPAAWARGITGLNRRSAPAQLRESETSLTGALNRAADSGVHGRHLMNLMKPTIDRRPTAADAQRQAGVARARMAPTLPQSDAEGNIGIVQPVQSSPPSVATPQVARR